MKLVKSDLSKIGHTLFNKNGVIAVVCYLLTANLEEILLREILKEFGNYKITSIKEKKCECCGEIDIVFNTNLPVRLIEDLHNKTK